MKNQYTKGNYLYLQNKKRMEIIKTIVFFGISEHPFTFRFIIMDTALLLAGRHPKTATIVR